MQDINQNYISPETLEDESSNNDMEVELATPGSRIIAALINSLISIVLFIPLFMYAFSSRQGNSDSKLLIILMSIGLILYVAFGIYQIVIMTKYGQSFGKKIMGIKVITMEGNNPGFVTYPLVREFAYNLIINILGLIPLLGGLISLGSTIALFVMLFLVESKRRTLQDMLAKTLVVKA